MVKAIKRETVHFRVTDDFRAALVAAAQAAKVKPADFARRAVEASLFDRERALNG